MCYVHLYFNIIYYKYIKADSYNLMTRYVKYCLAVCYLSMLEFVNVLLDKFSIKYFIYLKYN